MDSEQFLSDLIQKNADAILAHAYDPVKAREYYLKTRELKGRKGGVAPAPSKRTSLSTPPQRTNSSMVRPTAAPAVSAAKRASARSAATKARVQAIRGKLDKLDAAYDALVEKRAAKREDSSSSDKDKKSDTSEKSKDKEKNSDKEPAEKLTAAEKAKKAKKAREDYESVAKDDSSSLTIEELDAKISKINEQRKELKSRLRQILSGSKGQIS